MRGFDWLRERAENMKSRRLEGVDPAELSRLEAEHGHGAVLDLRHDTWYSLSRECFRAGLFADAAEYFRRRNEATAELADALAEDGDAEGASREREELARRAWQVGDLALFRRYVSEGCDPASGVTPRLDVFPAMFMSWAVVGGTFHPAHWSERFEEAVERERRGVRRRWEGGQRDAVERLTIDSRMALSSFWLGEFPRALQEARRALDGFRGWAKHRPNGLEVPHKRVWRNRMQGMVTLLEGREDSASLDQAVQAFEKALAGSALTRYLDWKDIVLLHLIARAWRDPEDPMVREFGEGFPHLRHLLGRERHWAKESV